MRGERERERRRDEREEERRERERERERGGSHFVVFSSGETRCEFEHRLKVSACRSTCGTCSLQSQRTTTSLEIKQTL